MVLGALAGGVCASNDEDSSRNPRILNFKLVSSRRAGFISAGHVGGGGGFQQNHGDCVFRRGFGSGVAPDASPLLATAYPEKSCFPLQDFSLAVEQFDLQRLVGGYVNEKRSVALDRRRTQQAGMAGIIGRIE